MAEEIKLPEGVTEKEAKKFLKSLKKEPIVFKEIEIGYNTILRIHKTYFKGRYLLAIQKFWREDETQDWQYGKAISFPDEVIDDIIDGFTKMKTYVEGEQDA